MKQMRNSALGYKRILSPLGIIEIGANEEGICKIGFVSGEEPSDTERKEDGAAMVFGREAEERFPILHEAAGQLEEYMEGKRKTFDLPLSMEGTPFQKKVWNALCQIPYGQTRTYGQIASLVGCPGGSRAVGMANHRNPIGIVVPCHRVIGSDGSLTGYAGGVDKKEGLLKLEKGGQLI